MARRAVWAVPTLLLGMGVVSASLGCGGASDARFDRAAEVERELPLGLEIEHVEIAHGGLRVTALMSDGSPDVSLWLAAPCPEREVGSGVATRTRFAWTLSTEDVAQALECQLTVRARVRDVDEGRVRRVASLPVVAKLAYDDGDDTPYLDGHRAEGGATNVVFRRVPRGARFSAGDTTVSAISETDDYLEGHTVFRIRNTDLARVVLDRSTLALRATELSWYTATLSIAGNDIEPPEEAVPVTVEEVD